MLLSKRTCNHLNGIDKDKIKLAQEPVCEECVKTGGEWVHLRTCQTCGATLCCDNSPNRHATKHYLSTRHPVIASAETGEQWLWCYPHDLHLPY